MPANRSVVVDASVMVALCANEPQRYQTARAELARRIALGHTLHAPHLIVMEVLYVLCCKLHGGSLTRSDHDNAVANLVTAMATIVLPADGDVAFAERAEQLRQGYGCSRSADSVYLALAESLTASATVEIVTYDAGLLRQAAMSVPAVTVTLL